MVKKRIKFKDYDGVVRYENFYFNLSRAELIELEMETPGGIEEYLKQIVDSRDTKKLMRLFKNLIAMSYGEKSPDGRRFVKSPELTETFLQTEAYSELMVEFLGDGTGAAAAEFVKGIIPGEWVEEVNKINGKDTETSVVENA